MIPWFSLYLWAWWPKSDFLRIYSVWGSWAYGICKFDSLTNWKLLSFISWDPFYYPFLFLSSIFNYIYACQTFGNCSIYIHEALFALLLLLLFACFFPLSFRWFTFYWPIFKLPLLEESHKKQRLPCTDFNAPPNSACFPSVSRAWGRCFPFCPDLLTLNFPQDQVFRSSFPHTVSRNEGYYFSLQPM